MSDHTRRFFRHRLNANGSFDSICTECHMMVTSTRFEMELAHHEQVHTCDPQRLYQIMENPFTFRQFV